MKLCSQKVLGPGNSIGWLASASDIYISGVVYISGFRMLFSAHAHGYNWDDLACRYFDACMRTIKLCALFSHDTVASNFIITLSLQLNHKLLQWNLYLKLMCMLDPYSPGQVVGVYNG